MLTRSLLVAAIASTLFACTMTPDPQGTVAGAGSSTKTPTSSSDDKNDATAASTSATTTSTLDGTWDITADGLAASSITVAGGKITGTLVYGDEGTSPDGICTVTQDRTTITMTVSGDTMTGSVAKNYVLSGDPDQCVGDTGTTNITATRTHAAANASGQTPVEGAWVMSADDGSQPFAVTVAGLAAQIWETTQQVNKDMDVAVKSGAATGNYAGDNAPGQAFAARKR